MTPRLLESMTAPILVVEDSDEDFDTLRDAAAAAGVTRNIYHICLTVTACRCCVVKGVYFYRRYPPSF